MTDQVRTLRPLLNEVSLVVIAEFAETRCNRERFKLEHEDVIRRRGGLP